MAALIDQYLPRFDVRETHRIRVRASPDTTWAALHRADLARSPLVGALLVIRALPAALASGRAGLDRLRHGSGVPPVEAWGVGRERRRRGTGGAPLV